MLTDAPFIASHSGHKKAISSDQLVAFAINCKLIAPAGTKGLTEEKVALVFQAVKLGKKTTINFTCFQEAVRKLAVEHGTPLTEMVQQISENFVGPSANTAVESANRKTRDGRKSVGVLNNLRLQATLLLETVHRSEYEIVYESREALRTSGVETWMRLDRQNEWAIVREAPSFITIGSILTRVNGTSVMLGTYEQAMKSLEKAVWPLTMRFRPQVGLRE
jgi:hypothetical protein